MPAQSAPDTDTPPAQELTDDTVDAMFADITAGAGHGPCVCSCLDRCSIDCNNKADRGDGLCKMCRPFFDGTAAAHKHCHFLFNMMGDDNA